MRRFNKILVANRGEIAVRIMKTARELGYRTIAVYSDADRDAVHTHYADDAIRIGPGPVGQSYLNQDAVLAAVRESGAEAVHPGYGFLSENADFAQACQAAGLVFIGPSAEAIELMGNKAAAKRHMIEAGVPCVPGYQGTDQTDKTLLVEAERIGLPVMVKAAAGGGGRGMRLVESQDQLAGAIEAARSEALNAFGSDELILEKAILRPRHVEIQVFGDAQGNVIHLGERDCSIQRRHQKILEEAPCPVLSADQRDRMGSAAVTAAKSIGYQGAGTVEFLLAADGGFFFLEMNTRLQVEHPVTEMVTGVDLVALQLAVAQGEALPLAQEDVALGGHAIEARIYAEDVGNGFLPSTGTIARWCPAEVEGVRYDSGIEGGSEVSPYYDPMLAKVIACGATREVARARLIEALERTVIFGPSSNIGFLIDALSKPAFAKGEATTAFIAEQFDESDLKPPAPGPMQWAMAAVLSFYLDRQQALASAVAVSTGLLNWSSGGALETGYKLSTGEEDAGLSVSPQSDTLYRVRMGEDQIEIALLSVEEGHAVLTAGGQRHGVHFLRGCRGALRLLIQGRAYLFKNTESAQASAQDASGGRVTAPMHGLLLDIHVQSGDRVKVGDRLAVLEAMKMQHDIAAEIDGTVVEVSGAPGHQIAAGDLILEIDPKG